MARHCGTTHLQETTSEHALVQAQSILDQTRFRELDVCIAFRSGVLVAQYRHSVYRSARGEVLLNLLRRSSVIDLAGAEA